MVRKPVPLVVAMTLALGTFLLVSGLLVLSTLFVFVSSQLRHQEVSAAETKAAFLAQTFTVSLWNYALNDLRTVGDIVARDDSVLSLQITSDTGAQVYASSPKTGPALLTISKHLSYRGQTVGAMQLVASSLPLNRQIAALLGSGVLSFLVFVVLLLAISPLVLSRTILRPFENLAKTLSQESEHGHFPELPEPRSTIREIRLFETVLYELNQRVAHQMDSLEEQVAERTGELERAQERLVRSETLAHMGQLAATVAHELNTPLGASLSTTQNWVTDLNERWIPRIVKNWKTTLVQDPEGFMKNMVRLCADLSGSTNRAVRKQLISRWEAAGLDSNSDLFDLLTSTAAIGLFDEILGLADDQESLEIILSLGKMARDLSIIRQASVRAAEVVQGLRAQLTPSNSDTAYPVNLTASVNQALSLVKGRLGRNLHLEWDGSAEVWVLGIEGDLIRLVTNLVTNGIQAMNGSGTLDLSVRQTGTEGILCVSDTGPGIPQDLQARVFEPFFTTKDTGLGLGLDLVKRVVNAFQGTLHLTSEPGKTTFEVAFPRPRPNSV